jgi:flagellin
MGVTERTTIGNELSQYAQEIDDIVNTTKWNGSTLLTGSISMKFQTSADGAAATDYTTWTLTQAHDVSGTGTNGLGDLASVSGSTASETQDLGNVLVAGGLDATTATFSGLSQLSSGTYKIRVQVGATSGTGNSYAQLIDSSGNPLTVDANNADGGMMDNKVTFTYDYTASGGQTLNFGTGLQVTLTSAMVAGVKADATISYTKTGSYDATSKVVDGTESRKYMVTLDSAIGTVSASLSNIGSMVSRLTFKEDTLAIGKVNTDAAYNRVMNADMATEQLNSVKYQILQQSAISMLAQANMAPQSILKLMG